MVESALNLSPKYEFLIEKLNEDSENDTGNTDQFDKNSDNQCIKTSKVKEIIRVFVRCLMAAMTFAIA